MLTTLLIILIKSVVCKILFLLMDNDSHLIHVHWDFYLDYFFRFYLLVWSEAI